MLNLHSGKSICAVILLCTAATISAPAQTFTTLANFNVLTTGLGSQAPLIQGLDGNLYGTAGGGGLRQGGTVFKITPQGELSTVHYFCSRSPNCADGEGPLTGLVQSTNGDLYGTTVGGGNTGCPEGCGTIFQITDRDTLFTLYSFAGNDGEEPSSLIESDNGPFYGTTSLTTVVAGGTIFEMTPSGSLTTLYYYEGESPSSLFQAANHYFYGITGVGENGLGAIFRMTPTTLTTLHSFDGKDGSFPGSIVQATNGNFYGTTGGGPSNQGTIFEMTLNGTVTTLHTFDGLDGAGPVSLIQATDGNFYGTTFNEVGCNNGSGGAFCGTIFQMTPSGTVTTLYTFCSQPNCADGAGPVGGLFQATDGNFYGTTLFLSANDAGTVYRLSMGLAPFVRTVPTYGWVGRKVRILGSNLTGATSVTFNGTASEFTVVSPTEITTTVPAGATTGTLQVVTPGGTLSSNVVFQVP